MNTETAILGGGCYWCTEAVYQRIKGIARLTSGFSGGSIPNPTYKEVCTGNTGHAEVLKIDFDPAIISYSELLDIFFAIHDPTTLNRQGNDIGTQYRSVIFTLNSKQKELAELAIEKQQKSFDAPIVTEVTQLAEFFPAEDYHQDYFNNNPDNRYCQVVIPPKIEKIRKYFGDKTNF